MASQTSPKKPVDNWEHVRDEWVADVEQFVAQVEIWAHKQDWGTLRDLKTIEEDRLGSYTVPRLLVHPIFGRFVFSPVCRFVGGSATGLIDFYAMPSYDEQRIVRHADGHWFLHFDDGGQVRKRKWSEKLFVATIRQFSSS
jgi:hypothetical protein